MNKVMKKDVIEFLFKCIVVTWLIIITMIIMVYKYETNEAFETTIKYQFMADSLIYTRQGYSDSVLYQKILKLESEVNK